MNVGALCSRGPVCAEASAPLADVARLMCERHVGAVIVVKSPASSPVPVGILTDRDITRVQLERTTDLTQLTAAAVMTRDPLVLSETVSVPEAIAQMRTRGIRRAPVVSTHGTVIGMISTDDLIAQVARELSALSRALELQPLLEHLRR